MQIVDNIEDLPFLDEAAITVGNFDGFHLGHQAILSQLFKYNLKKILITFEPRPINFFNSKKEKENILTTDEKIAFLKDHFKLDYLVICPFTKDFSKITHQEFIFNLLVKIKLIHFVSSKNFRFGYRKEGSIDYLRSIDLIKVKEVESIYSDGKIISSTIIRLLINQSNLEQAKKLLGYFFFITGSRISGNKIGRTIGYPTINIQFPKEKVKLQEGVYETQIVLPNRQVYHSMTYLGGKKLGSYFKEGQIISETYIFDINDLVLSQEDLFLKIIFHRKIRDLYDFTTIDDLKIQLEKDRQYILKEKK